MLFFRGGINYCNVINGTVYRIYKKYVISYDNTKFYVYKRDRYKLLYTLSLTTFSQSNVDLLFLNEEDDVLIFWYQTQGCIIYKLSTGVKISQMLNTSSSYVEIGFAGSDQIINHKLSVKLTENFYNVPAQLNIPNLTIYKKISSDNSSRYRLSNGIFLDDNTFIGLKSGIDIYNISNNTKRYYYSSSNDAVAVAVNGNTCVVFIDNKAFCLKLNNGVWDGVWTAYNINLGSSVNNRLYYKYYFDSGYLYISDDSIKYEGYYNLVYYKIDLTNGSSTKIDNKVNYGWFNSELNEWVALSKVVSNGDGVISKTVISSIKDASSYLS